MALKNSQESEESEKFTRKWGPSDMELRSMQSFRSDLQIEMVRSVRNLKLSQDRPRSACPHSQFGRGIEEHKPGKKGRKLETTQMHKTYCQPCSHQWPSRLILLNSMQAEHHPCSFPSTDGLRNSSAGWSTPFTFCFSVNHCERADFWQTCL